MEPPMRPVPTTSARGGGSTPPSPSPSPSPSAREVIAEPLGAVEIDMVDLVPGPGRVGVEKHPDAQRHGARHGDLGRAEKGDGAEPDLPDGGGRKDAGHVGRG